jgi:GxxExxY protein
MRHREVNEDKLTEGIIGAAIAVHRAIGPGLLESVYHACLRHELFRREIQFESEVALPVIYDGRRMDAHFRLDLVVERELVVEPKCVEQLLPIHRVQLITYLRVGGFRRGLLINFSAVRLIDGLVRVVA